MPTVSLSSLPRALQADAELIKEELFRAIQKTAEAAVAPIKERVPVAFGELRDSVAPMDIGSEPKTCVDAPHAGAVEQGSLPHKPDWERLLAWVKLRGMQGLTRGGRIRTRFAKSEGPTTPGQAQRIAAMLKSYETRGGKGVGRHSPANAPEEVARRISKSIEEHGTPPHWYVRESLEDIRAILAAEVRKSFGRVSKAARRRR